MMRPLGHAWPRFGGGNAAAVRITSPEGTDISWDVTGNSGLPGGGPAAAAAERGRAR